MQTQPKTNKKPELPKGWFYNAARKHHGYELYIPVDQTIAEYGERRLIDPTLVPDGWELYSLCCGLAQGVMWVVGMRRKG
jgi:hypothetical protein